MVVQQMLEYLMASGFPDAIWQHLFDGREDDDPAALLSVVVEEWMDNFPVALRALPRWGTNIKKCNMIEKFQRRTGARAKPTFATQGGVKLQWDSR